jgi:hypothetical protein
VNASQKKNTIAFVAAETGENQRSSLAGCAVIFPVNILQPDVFPA